MKKILLLSLELRDFQGGNFNLIAKGQNVDIYGGNGTGKTRLFSAFTYLLFGKDSLNRADFELKNLDTQGKAEHGLEHSVGALINVDGEQIALKKVFKELWQKKRGSATSIFTGHTTQHYVNGVPKSEKEYKEKIAEIAGNEETFRLLTSPTAFPNLPWQKQRALLLEICGDMTDADVIATNEKLTILSEILGKRSIDDHRKIITAKKAEINKELEKIPVRIDEVRRGLPDITGLDRKAIINDIEKLEIALNEAKLKLQGVDTGGKLAELTKQIAIIDSELQKIESAHFASTTQMTHSLNQEISEIELKISTDKNRISALESDITHRKKQIDNLDPELVRLRERWVEIDAQAFQDNTLDVCPVCGQPLPSECVQEAREKAQATFNLKKAEDLAEIERKGMLLKDEKDRLGAENITATARIEAISKIFAEVGINLERLSSQRNAIKNAPKIAPTDLVTKKLGLEADIKTEKEGLAQDADKIREEIKNLEVHLKDSKYKIDCFTRREAGEKRIEELKTEEKKLASEYERLESELYLTEEFVRAKVNILTERINSKFEITRFKLFNTLVNGGIEECCTVTVQGIPFNGGLNSGARTNAGLDVIRTLQKHFGIQPVVFVDNAESIVELLPMKCQIVRLVVSEKDKVLRVEKAKEKVLA